MKDEKGKADKGLSDGVTRPSASSFLLPPSSLRPTPSSWLLLQLTDSAFPAGAFAHSNGLEAAWQIGEISSRENLSAYCRAAVQQAATTAGPLVVATMRQPNRLEEFDRFYDAMLTNPITRRASCAQGQALLAGATRIFMIPELRDRQTLLRGRALPGHLPVVFGAVYEAFKLDVESAVSHYLFIQLRGLISAAVRLGIVGPIEGQTIQHDLSADANENIRRCLLIERLEEACQTTACVDLFQSLHDRLYSRLFLS